MVSHQQERSIPFIHRPVTIFLIVSSIAFIIRLIYIFQIENSPFFYNLYLDSNNYDLWAQAIRRGTTEREFFLNPFYPYLLSGLYSIFGRDLLLVRLVQATLGGVTCFLITLLTNRLFSFRCAVIAGIITAFYGGFVFFEGEFIAISWVPPLVAACLLMALWAKERPTPSKCFLSGLFLGVAILARPNILIFVPALLGWFLWHFKNKDHPKAVILTCIFLLGSMLPIIPITLHNYKTTGDFILITSHGGINFYIGNYTDANGWFKVPKNLEVSQKGLIESSHREAEKHLKRKLSPKEVSRYWFVKALIDIKEKPQRWVKLLSKKLFYFMNSYERPMFISYYFNQKYSPLLKNFLIPYGFVVPFALIGMVLSFIRYKELSILYLFFFVYLATILIFFVSARYRLPALVSMIPFSSFALNSTFNYLKNKDWKRVILIGATLGAIFFLTNLEVLGKRTDMAFIYFYLGNIYRRQNNYQEAAEQYKKATDIFPGNDEFHRNYALSLFKLGLHEKAEAAYKLASRYKDQEDYITYLNLGDIYFDLKKYLKAKDFYLKAIAGNDRLVAAYGNLGNIYYAMSQYNRAEDSWQKALSLDPAYTNTAYNYTQYLTFKGRYKEAVDIWKRALIKNPKDADAHNNLGTALLRYGKVAEAIGHYKEALRIEPDHKDAHYNLGALYRDRKTDQ